LCARPWSRTASAIFSSSSTSAGADEKSLTERLRQSYSRQESDGVMELALSHSDKITPPAEQIFAHIQEASANQKGVEATMLNSWIASKMLGSEAHQDASNALDLLNLWEEKASYDGETVATPDLVTYSVAYSAISRDERRIDDANIVLARAQKWSKKVAGSKRRRALAAARRHKPNNAEDRIDDIRELLNDSEFDVLLETSDFLVANKPAGIACSHRVVTTAGKKRSKGRKTSDMSLVDALLHCNVQLSTLNAESQGLVHRLDRGTSGCIFLAKTDPIHAHAVAQFFTRQVRKSYVTLVSPAPAKRFPESGTLDIPVNGRPARSDFRVLERFGESAGHAQNSAATIEMRTLTGRKHQVRVHASQGLNAPVVNDPVYGVAAANLPQIANKETTSRERFFLHAATLSIPALDISVEAPVPGWWKTYMDHFEKQ